MCNCGNKRNEFSNGQFQQVFSTQPIPDQGTKMWPDINFVYTGKTALSVTGKFTGIQYRFMKPGEVQKIDFRDAPSMMAVPVLKRVH